jgi:16S rRNA (guanine527-N7)-methyltransferase
MEYTEFWTLLSANNVVLNVEQIEQFKRYEKELLYWNEKVNLISRKDYENILERHFLHSLSILKYIDFPKKAKCLDIGTGGGFPGLPIKIALPEIYLTLSDSIRKKLKITEIFAKHTALRNIECKFGRVEDLQKVAKSCNYFDVILSRAVAQTSQLIEWTLPLLKKNGKFIFLKGGNLEAEISDAKAKFPQLTFEIIEIDLLGCKWFSAEEKKIVLAHF